MKRILIVMFLILSLVISLPACKKDDVIPTPQIEENPDFATYNAMFDKEFIDYTIEVSITGIEDDVTNEKYTVKTENGTRSVEYRIERLNQFIIEGDQITIPEGYVSVVEGVYDAEASASPKFDIPKFKFSYTCLGTSDITIPNSYSTSITSLEQFMGSTLNVTNASVKLSFNGNEATAISISYVTEAENTVVITYTFN